MIWIVAICGIVLGVLVMVIYDQIQTKHAILKNFPIIGHFRYWLEAVGPELRQYIVTSNDEERPFSRDQRRWVYASAKKQNNYFGFGTDNDLDKSPGYVVIKHNAIPLGDPGPGQIGSGELHAVPCAKVLGEARNRPKAFRCESIVNISAMSFGSLSSAAIEALNRGCKIAGSLHNTGEGGISPYHGMGGGLIWQIGTGYFGCRDESGSFSINRLIEQCDRHDVMAIEIKLSQGAKPGIGGVLPGAKVTPEIAAIRGIPVGRDCLSPPSHSTFSDADSMLDFVEMLADRTGLPVGIKSAVGGLGFFEELAGLMESGNRGLDFLTIDGGEGGTGAAPLVFSDHVSLPFRVGFPRVYRIFAERGVADRVVFIGSGRLGFPDRAMLAMALGCDMINVAREAMLAVGCIQAQRCHTGHCPTGVATQNQWLVRGLDPTNKSHRLANYLIMLRKDLIRLSRACGCIHPALVTLDRFELLGGDTTSTPAPEMFEYQPGWGMPPRDAQDGLVELRITNA
ncbi:MAG TPA: FMN-binding glutamate synthase family protein [Phycisphaerales bacterium]|nr:FMN-binding glutamate synthase family protein [Phycisphaerales bacterium]